MEKKTVIKIHIIFWIVASSIPLLNVFAYIGDAYLLFTIVTFYTFYFIVSKVIFSKKGILKLVLFELAYLVISGLFVSVIYYYLLTYFLAIKNPSEYSIINAIKNNIFNIDALHLIYSILGGLSKVTLIWYRNQMKHKETEKQNNAIELAMLRAQINPHFLFNTLNNIKSLIMSLPLKAKYSVNKLTNIMRYMLYESSLETVPLVNEIGHINNYLELEKIRYREPDFIDFKISGDYSKISIPPLIFMPFIENAFKHGDKLKPAPGIIIKIDIFGTNINFEIKNFMKEDNCIQNKNSGFGLSNIRRRLDLLFDNKYDLRITNENKIYKVKLNLNLP